MVLVGAAEEVFSALPVTYNGGRLRVKGWEWEPRGDECQSPSADPVNCEESERAEPGRVIGGRRYLTGPLIRHPLAHAFDSSGVIKSQSGKR